jgi:MFS family permease
MEPDGTRAARVRRNTIRLIVAQGALMSAIPIVFVLGVVAIVDLTDRERWGGVFLAEFNVAAAVTAILVGRLMDRVGRRPGLMLGYVLLGAGGIGAAIAVANASRWALLAMALPLGAGLGAGQLGRVAVADMYPSDQRGRQIGILIATGTVGAIAGPPLVAGIEAATGSDVAPWFLVPVVALVGLVAAASLKPDPSELAVEEHVVDTGARRSPRELLRLTPFRAAVVAVGIAQTAMVAVMGVTPVVIDDRGGSSLTIALVISVHIAGMFALSPVVGYLLDRYGRRRGLLVGGVLSASGALLGSFTEAPPLVGVGLFLVGLGWSACFLGATATISDLTAVRERGGALGFTDLFTSLASAIGALSGGFVLEAAGIAVVGLTMAVLMLPVLLMVLPLREPAPGRWAMPTPGKA